MDEFNKEDFFDNRYKLREKYELVGSGIEGDGLKVNNYVFAKKFYTPRDFLLKETQEKLYELELKNIIAPFDYLEKSGSICAVFLDFFDGSSVLNDVGEIKFDVLIESTKNLIEDMRKISDNNIRTNDITRKSIMYNDQKMALIDTTQYFIIYHNLEESLKERLNKNNLRDLFYKTEIFYSKTWDEIIKRDKILKELKFDYDNYNYFYIELKRFLEELSENKVESINDGLSKIKRKK